MFSGTVGRKARTFSFIAAAEALKCKELDYFRDSFCMKMFNSYHKPAAILHILIISITLSSCISNLTKQTVVYSNDFDGSNLKGIVLANYYGPIRENKFFSFNGSTVLGRFNNTALDLTIDKLSSHDYLRIEFDLYTHDAWDGNTTTGHPALWSMQVDGAQIITSTFSNIAGMPQSYPYFLDSNNPQPARGNAADTSLPGVCAFKGKTNGTTRYRIQQTLVHSSSQVSLHLNDALYPFMDDCSKSWSIDNLVISVLKN